MTQLSMANRTHDQELADLVDAIVAVADLSRWDEVNRLRDALEPFGAVSWFEAELRLNGRTDDGDLCCGECLCGELAEFVGGAESSVGVEVAF